MKKQKETKEEIIKRKTQHLNGEKINKENKEIKKRKKKRKQKKEGKKKQRNKRKEGLLS